MSKAKTLVPVDHPGLADLTAKERAFVTHPLVATDPVQAATDAGYVVTKDNNYSIAYVKSKQLLDYILHYERQRMAKHEITADAVAQELASIGFSDPADLIDTIDIATGTISVPKDIKRLPPRVRRAIKSIRFVDGFAEIEFWSKIEALRELGKHLGVGNPKKPTGDDPIGSDQQQLLEQMSEAELQQVNNAFLQAGKRVAAIRSRKKDANAITVEKVDDNEKS